MGHLYFGWIEIINNNYNIKATVKNVKKITIYKFNIIM